MDIFNFFVDYPEIAGCAVGMISASAGWIGRNFFDILVEKKRYKRELKTYLWKEKINASKKASEYYIEYANLLNLIQKQLENSKLQKQEYATLIENLQKEIMFYENKLKSFPHFEHHHINIFYEFEEELSLEIGNEIYSTLRQIMEISPETDDIEKVQSLYQNLENNYQKLIALYRRYTSKIREDLKDYI